MKAHLHIPKKKSSSAYSKRHFRFFKKVLQYFHVMVFFSCAGILQNVLKCKVVWAALLLGNPHRSVYTELSGLKKQSLEYQCEEEINCSREIYTEISLINQDDLLKNESVSPSCFVTVMFSKIQNYILLSHSPKSSTNTKP